MVKVKFIFVGLWNTGFSYGVFFGLDSLFTHLFDSRFNAYMLAMILSQFIGIICGYLLHKNITFSSSVSGKEGFFEFLRFTSVNILTFFLNLGLLPLFVEVLLFDPKIAALVLIPIMAFISFMSHLKFSFKS